MDNLAIKLVEIWNAIAYKLGAYSLIMLPPSADNGYMLVLIVLSIFGGGFYVFFSIGDDD